MPYWSSRNQKEKSKPELGQDKDGARMKRKLQEEDLMLEKEKITTQVEPVSKKVFQMPQNGIIFTVF